MTNRLHCRIILNERTGEYVDTWSILLMRLGDLLHFLLATPRYTSYSTAQLRKLHKPIAHPSAQKLYQLLKVAGIDAVTPKMQEKLERIAVNVKQAKI